MLISALLFHRKFKKDLEGIDCKFNPHDACVANRKINGKQLKKIVSGGLNWNDKFVISARCIAGSLT